MKVVRYLLKLVVTISAMTFCILMVMLILLHLSISVGMAILGGGATFVILFIFLIPYLFQSDISEYERKENEKKKQTEDNRTTSTD